jgi:hypothetical protein
MSPVRPTVQLIGTRLDPAAHRVRDFLTRIAQPHELLEAGSPEARALLDARGAAAARTPALIDGDSVLEGVTVASLAIEVSDQASCAPALDAGRQFRTETALLDPHAVCPEDEGKAAGQEPDVFIAGDEAEAKQIVA